MILFRNRRSIVLPVTALVAVLACLPGNADASRPRGWQPRGALRTAVTRRPKSGFPAKPPYLKISEIRRAIFTMNEASARSGWATVGGSCWLAKDLMPIVYPEETAASAEFEVSVGRAMAGMLQDAVLAAKKRVAASVLASKALAAKKQLALMGLKELTRGNVDLIQVVSMGATHTGADPSMMLAIAWTESLFITTSTTSMSSATGPFQFTTGGWISAVHNFGSQHGLGAWASKTDLLRDGSTVGYRLGTRGIAEMNAFRTNTWLSSLLAGENVHRDTDKLRVFLGREPNAADIYLTHVLGYGGAVNFIRIVQTEPLLLTDEALEPVAASNNPSLFMKNGEFITSMEAYNGIKAMMEARQKVFTEVLEVGTEALMVTTLPTSHSGNGAVRYMASNRAKRIPVVAALRFVTAAR